MMIVFSSSCLCLPHSQHNSATDSEFEFSDEGIRRLWFLQFVWIVSSACVVKITHTELDIWWAHRVAWDRWFLRFLSGCPFRQTFSGTNWPIVLGTRTSQFWIQTFFRDLCTCFVCVHNFFLTMTQKACEKKKTWASRNANNMSLEQERGVFARVDAQWWKLKFSYVSAEKLVSVCYLKETHKKSSRADGYSSSPCQFAKGQNCDSMRISTVLSEILNIHKYHFCRWRNKHQQIAGKCITFCLYSKLCLSQTSMQVSVLFLQLSSVLSFVLYGIPFVTNCRNVPFFPKWELLLGSCFKQVKHCGDLCWLT